MRKSLPVVVTLLAALASVACFKGEVASGTLRVICGGKDNPCNFRIVAPLTLEGAALDVDGVEQFPLMPDEIEHPLRNVILRFVGSSPKSSVAVAILYLPPGTHLVHVAKPGFEAITRAVTSVKGRTNRLVIATAEVRPEARSSARCIERTVRSSDLAPELRIPSPMPFSGTNVVVQGVTDPKATVQINGQSVAVESSGEFRELIVYRQQLNTELIVRATNANGYTELVRCLVFEESSTRP